MKPFLSSLTANLLLIHAFAGCCWHAAHDCADCDNPAQIAATSLASCRQHCHHHDCDDAAPDRHEAPCHCQLECHEVCIYLPSQKTRLEASRMAVPFDPAMIATLPCDGRFAVHAEAQARLATTWAPPMRLHLLRRILLI